MTDIDPLSDPAAVPPVAPTVAPTVAPAPPVTPERPSAMPASTAPTTAGPTTAGPTPAGPATAGPVAPRRRGFAWPLLGLLGFLLLAGGELYLWRLEQLRPDPTSQIAALQDQLAALQATPPAPAAPAAPATPPPAAAAAPQDAGLAQKLAAQAAQLSALQANAIDIGKLSAQLGAVQTETTVDHTAFIALQANIADLARQASRAAAAGRLSAAALALSAGQPLGAIPNAPPALTLYATTPPPTEAMLRLNFPAAARAAARASVTADGKPGYWAAVKARLENLITISNGSHVIIGAPAAGVLARAGASLDAGDLAGAVAQLNTLNPATQQAMADWLTQARGLLAARNALVALAGQP